MYAFFFLTSMSLFGHNLEVLMEFVVYCYLY